MAFSTASVSKCGGRSNNEDYCRFVQLSGCGCWVVADGLGGHSGGEIASRMAVDTIIDSFTRKPGVDHEALMRYLNDAQTALVEYQYKNPAFSGMRTTVVVMVSDYKSAIWAHLGDSRLYLFKSGSITRQTKDHSVPQALVRSGEISYEDIRFHEDRNLLLRTLGYENNLRPAIESQSHTTGKGDAFLLCTDGFWEYVTETEMEMDLACSDTPDAWIEKMEKRLQTRVDGKNDNYTAITIIV